MNKEALAHWKCAKEDLLVAQHDLEISARNAASKAYYAAFHAVSALFAIEGKTFSKHSAIESAVHRELIKTKRWSKELELAILNFISCAQRVITMCKRILTVRKLKLLLR